MRLGRIIVRPHDQATGLIRTARRTGWASAWAAVLLAIVTNAPFDASDASANSLSYGSEVSPLGDDLAKDAEGTNWPDEPEGTLTYNQQFEQLAIDRTDFSYSVRVCQTLAGSIPDPDRCEAGAKGTVVRNLSVGIELTRIDPETIAIETKHVGVEGKVEPRMLVRFRCDFDTFCDSLSADDRPAYWWPGPAFLCQGPEACHRMAATLEAAISDAHKAQEELWLRLGTEPQAWFITPGVRSIVAEGILSRWGKLFKGATYASDRAVFVTDYYFTLDTMRDRSFVHFMFICGAKKTEPQKLLDACRRAEAAFTKLSVRVRLDALDETKIIIDSAADKVPGGIGYAIRVPCIGGRECVRLTAQQGQETRDSMQSFAPFPCDDVRACKALVGTLTSYITIVKANQITPEGR